jgi:L-alanine-DL-glutamate epimerase-like enolase superfamily enzyme
VAQQIAGLAAARERWVVPHCWSSDILVAATAHFLAALPQPPLLEFNVMDQPLRTRLVLDPLRPVGGVLVPPTHPGLGIELDPATVEEFTWRPS